MWQQKAGDSESPSQGAMPMSTANPKPPFHYMVVAVQPRDNWLEVKSLKFFLRFCHFFPPSLLVDAHLQPRRRPQLMALNNQSFYILRFWLMHSNFNESLLANLSIVLTDWDDWPVSIFSKRILHLVVETSRCWSTSKYLIMNLTSTIGGFPQV